MALGRAKVVIDGRGQRQRNRRERELDHVHQLAAYRSYLWYAGLDT